MNKSLTLRLAFAFILIAFLTSLLVAVMIRATSVNRLYQLIIDQQRSNMEEILSSYYAANGSWNGIENYWREIQFVTEERGNGPMERNGGMRSGMGGTNLFGLADEQGVVLIPVLPDYPRSAVLQAKVLKAGTPITVDGKKVGTVLTPKSPPGFSAAESLFLRRTNQALFLAMIGAMVFALVMGILLARTLTRPLKALTSAAQAIAAGDLEQEVEVHSQDEIGQLATTFNRMSQEVSRANQQRRQMTADIAHDLRTPLTVISGYIESMRDGVLQPTPQRLAMIYSETERLQKMVAELRMLTQADAGELPINPQPISPAEFLVKTGELFQHQAEQQEIQLEVSVEDHLPPVLVDETRLMQVMDNLLSNAFRYSPTQGRIVLGARKAGSEVDIFVQDSGAGIPDEELSRIFNRFYRADKSRHAESGESGLGLAIVKALVEAHHGRVWAESNQENGTTVHVCLPAASSS